MSFIGIPSQMMKAVPYLASFKIRPLNSPIFRDLSVSKKLERRALLEKRNRPFSLKSKARDEFTAKSVSRYKKDGHILLEKALAKHVSYPPGKIDGRTNQFRIIPEMIPEFIVPDLTNFKLKPYVSYRSEEITQSKITARDLFNVCYSDKIKEIKEQKEKETSIKGQLKEEDGKS